MPPEEKISIELSREECLLLVGFMSHRMYHAELSLDLDAETFTRLNVIRLRLADSVIPVKPSEMDT
jgi:hypothetical protein